MKSLYIVLARHQVDLDQWLWGAEDSGLLDEEFVLVVPSSPAYADLGVILAGELKRAVKLQGLLLTKGARAAVEAAGGSIAE